MKPRVATTWLDGCSGCHMSFLDLDERLIDVAGLIDLVYSPIVDIKEFPENVDVTLVEGAVGNSEELEKLELIRKRTKLLVSLGDCAVTGNVPSMRNPFALNTVLERAYCENVSAQPQIPRSVVPKLLRRARPLHEFVKVDLHIPGCPAPTEAIFYTLTELLAGRVPDLAGRTRFGI